MDGPPIQAASETHTSSYPRLTPEKSSVCGQLPGHPLGDTLITPEPLPGGEAGCGQGAQTPLSPLRVGHQSEAGRAQLPAAPACPRCA